MIDAGQSPTLTIQFAPNTAGSFNATVALTSDASNNLADVSVSGSGVTGGLLALNPTSAAFGTVTVGSTKTQTATLTNSGATAVDISQSSVSGRGFQISGLTTPLTLKPSQSTTLTVAFAPTAAGSVTGSVTIASDASNPTLTMACPERAAPPRLLSSRFRLALCPWEM